jgi:2-polyprenyl-6-methoxyphenol hydroxylase-like FAD-dependent oxidoreductase
LSTPVLEHGVDVEFAQRLVGVSDDGQRVTATFADGSEATGDVLVGCDGIHSVTRRAILPDGPAPAYTGLVGTEGFVRLPDGPQPSPVMEMTFGLRAFFGYQVTPSGEIYWFQNTPESAEPQVTGNGDGDERWKARLVELHRDDHEPLPTMLRATEGGIGRFPIYDLATLPTWHAGRVALAGDAAHVMGPYTGQGTAMALEDAMVLGMCLRDIPDIDIALAAYEQRRRPRVERVVKLTRRVGNTKSPGPLGRAVRDRILPSCCRWGSNRRPRSTPTASTGTKPSNGRKYATEDDVSVPRGDRRSAARSVKPGEPPSPFVAAAPVMLGLAVHWNSLEVILAADGELIVSDEIPCYRTLGRTGGYESRSTPGDPWSAC